MASAVPSKELELVIIRGELGTVRAHILRISAEERAVLAERKLAKKTEELRATKQKLARAQAKLRAK